MVHALDFRYFPISDHLKALDHLSRWGIFLFAVGEGNGLGTNLAGRAKGHVVLPNHLGLCHGEDVLLVAQIARGFVPILVAACAVQNLRPPPIGKRAVTSGGKSEFLLFERIELAAGKKSVRPIETLPHGVASGFD